MGLPFTSSTGSTFHHICANTHIIRNCPFVMSLKKVIPAQSWCSQLQLGRLLRPCDLFSVFPTSFQNTTRFKFQVCLHRKLNLVHILIMILNNSNCSSCSSTMPFFLADLYLSPFRLHVLSSVCCVCNFHSANGILSPTCI